MFAGVKFIPRDERRTEDADSDSDSYKERKGSSNRKVKSKSRKNKYESSSSDDEDFEKIKRHSSGKKKWYSSENSSSSLESDVSSDFDEKQNGKVRKKSSKKESSHYRRKANDNTKKLKKKSKKGKKQCLYDPYSSSTSESEDQNSKVEKDKSKERSHKKHRDLKILSGDGSELLPTKDLELARKEMGLDWMLKPETVPVQQSESDNSPHEPQVEEVKQPNHRELNPYFKNNGSGFPESDTQINTSSNLGHRSMVGDGGVSWRLKALKRAKEQAAREGRKLDEVVEERWGSLGELAVSLASQNAAPARAHLHAIRERKMGQSEKHGALLEEGKNTELSFGERRRYLHDVTSRHPEMREPKVHGSLSWRKGKGQKISKDGMELISEAAFGLNKYANDGNFMQEITQSQKSSNLCVDYRDKKFEGNENKESSETIDSKQDSGGHALKLNANQLAAKVMQLRMKGKHEEAERLLKNMECDVKEDVENYQSKRLEEISINRRTMRDISSHKKKRDDDLDLNLAQKIAHNKQYSMARQVDDEYDYDDVPIDKRRRNKKSLQHNKQSEKYSISKGLLTQQERCQFCFENSTRPKHLIVSIGNFTYLMLPQCEPVVPGHCCILPLQHESASRSVDNNVWEELRNFKKCLLMMFAKQDKEVVFLETVIGLSQQRRHCMIECIPLPPQVAKQAPMYFKKAIDEAEEEWSQHNAKRLIDTSAKGLRGSIPKDFPYFHVEFGLSKGFVHVIEDEQQFKLGLGLNVIRGMLQLPEEDMYRRRRRESLETQRQSVASFAREWEPFDWTKQLD